MRLAGRQLPLAPFASPHRPRRPCWGNRDALRGLVHRRPRGWTSSPGVFGGGGMDSRSGAARGYRRSERDRASHGLCFVEHEYSYFGGTIAGWRGLCARWILRGVRYGICADRFRYSVEIGAGGEEDCEAVDNSTRGRQRGSQPFLRHGAPTPDLWP